VYESLFKKVCFHGITGTGVLDVAIIRLLSCADKRHCWHLSLVSVLAVLILALVRCLHFKIKPLACTATVQRLFSHGAGREDK
jgi:hypothetical protein